MLETLNSFFSTNIISSRILKFSFLSKKPLFTQSRSKLTEMHQLHFATFLSLFLILQKVIYH